MSASQSLYDILGVPRDASPEDIKTAYMRRRKEMHPDHGGDHDEFVAFQQAYDVLSNPETREQYDETGEVPGQERDDTAQVLAALMFQILDKIDPDTDNLVEAMKEYLQTSIAGANQEIAGIADKISKYERTIKRLSRKGGENVMQSFLTVKVDTLRKKIDQISHVITDMTKLIEVVDTYVYEVDEPPKPQASDWQGAGLPKMFGRYPYRYPGEGSAL